MRPIPFNRGRMSAFVSEPSLSLRLQLSVPVLLEPSDAVGVTTPLVYAVRQDALLLIDLSASSIADRACVRATRRLLIVVACRRSMRTTVSAASASTDTIIAVAVTATNMAAPRR